MHDDQVLQGTKVFACDRGLLPVVVSYPLRSFCLCHCRPPIVVVRLFLTALGSSRILALELIDQYQVNTSRSQQSCQQPKQQ